MYDQHPARHLLPALTWLSDHMTIILIEKKKKRHCQENSTGHTERETLGEEKEEEASWWPYLGGAPCPGTGWLRHGAGCNCRVFSGWVEDQEEGSKGLLTTL